MKKSKKIKFFEKNKKSPKIGSKKGVQNDPGQGAKKGPKIAIFDHPPAYEGDKRCF